MIISRVQRLPAGDMVSGSDLEDVAGRFSDAEGMYPIFPLEEGGRCPGSSAGHMQLSIVGIRGCMVGLKYKLAG